MDTSYRNYDSQSPTVPKLAPISNMEFPPLSQQPRVEGVMPRCNPVDLVTPEKFTPVPPGQDDWREKKDVSQVIHQTENLISSGNKQLRHVNAITMELKLLLEHEEKILQQVVTRIDKFKNLRDENKRKAVEWEEEYQKILPEYDMYSTKLVNVPQSQPITVEGVPGPVQQKILFQIVSRTANTADRVVVSLSMEQTVANDIDLTLGGLKKTCIVMLKRIRGWLRMLKTAECEQNVVLERWNRHKAAIKEMKSKSDAVSMATVGSATNLVHHLKPYEDRIKRLEEAVCKMGGPTYGTCATGRDKSPAGKPGKPPGSPGNSDRPTGYPPYDQQLDPDEERLRRMEEAICKLCPAIASICPPTPPNQGAGYRY